MDEFVAEFFVGEEEAPDAVLIWNQRNGSCDLQLLKSR